MGTLDPGLIRESHAAEGVVSEYTVLAAVTLPTAVRASSSRQELCQPVSTRSLPAVDAA